MKMKELDTYLSYGLYGILFTIPFIALIITEQLFFPFITGKNFTFRILIEIAFVLYLLRIFINKDIRPKRSWIIIAYSIFFFVITLASIFGVDPIRSFWSNFERMEGLVGHIHLFAYFLILIGTINTKKLWERLFQTSLFASVIVSIYSILQIFGFVKIFQSTNRIEATFGNSSYLAVYLLFNIFIAGFLLFDKKHSIFSAIFAPFHFFKKRHDISKTDLLYWGIIILELIILLFTETRGAIIGLLASVIIMAFLQIIFNVGKVRKAGAILLLGTILLTSLFIAFKDTSFIKNNKLTGRLSSISLRDSSVQARFTVWGMAYEGFREKPLLGWGVGNFNVVFNKYYKPELFGEEPWFDRAHDVFFDWLTNAGIIGLLSYLSLFIASLYYLLFKESKHISLNGRIILTGLLATYFIQNIFVFDNLISYILFFTILGYIHSMYKTDWVSEKARKITNIQFPDSAVFVVAPILIILLGVSVFYINVKPIQTARGMIIALSTTNENEGIEYNERIIEKAIDNGYLGKQEVSEQYIQFAFNISRNNSIPEKDRLNLLNRAQIKMVEMVEIRPLDARPKLFLGTFLSQFQDFEGALKYLEEARALSPNKQSILSSLSNIYIATGDFEKAFELSKKSLSLESKNKEAAISLITSAIVSGRQELADKTLIEYFSTVNLPDERIAQAYMIARNKKKAIKIFEAMKEANPSLSDRIDEVIKQINNTQ